MLFNELSHDAKTAAVEVFIKSFNEFLGIEDDDSLDRGITHDFLSKSKVHQYDKTGKFLGRITRYKRNIHRSKCKFQRRAQL